MKDKAPGKGKVINSASEILKQLQAKKSPTQLKAITVGSMIEIWHEVVPHHNSGVHFVGNFTLVQKGMFSKLIVRWGGSANMEIPPLLTYLLSHWTKYAKYVESVAAVKTTPALPTINFLLKYAEEGRNLFADENLSPAPKITLKVQPVQVIAPVVELEPEEAPMTMTELKELGKKYGLSLKK